MEILRNIGTSVFTWTDVVTGITGTRTDLARGSAVTVSYSDVEHAWKNGTITLAQSSTSTGTTDTISLWVSSGPVAGRAIIATVNNTNTSLAVG